MKSLYKSLFLALLLFLAFSATAQYQVKSAYFIENDPLRHQFNPAFQPQAGLYISIPVLGYTQANVEMPVMGSDLLYHLNGNDYWFLDKNVPNGRENFLKTLGNHPMINLGGEINLFSLGWRVKKSYITISASEKMAVDFALPKGVFNMLLDGLAPSGEDGDDFVFNFGLDASLYTEIAAGYSLKINDQLTAGVKLKALLGTADISARNENLILTTGIDQWRLRGNDTWSITTPLDQLLNDEGKFDPVSPRNVVAKLVSGFGGAIDIGVTYDFKTFPLKLSAAITDLGSIRWKGSNNIHYTADFAFEGVNKTDFNFDDFEGLIDSIADGFVNSFTYEEAAAGKAYTHSLSPKFLLSAQYPLLKNDLLGATALYQHSNYYDEFTAAITSQPAKWANLAVNYSFSDGLKTASFGFAFGLKLAFLHISFATDYISLNNARVTIDNGEKVYRSPALIPYRQSGFNYKAGINLVFK
jgi:hypothetical protein